MKIGTRSLQGPREDVLVLPRQGEEDIVFKARAVLDFSDFEKLCPPPQMRKILYRGEQVARENPEDPEYKAEVVLWSLNRQHWLILKSLEVTDGLTWETIDPANPQTWGNYLTELQAANFTTQEITLIRNLAIAVNYISQDRLDEARKRFLASSREAVSVP